MVRRRGCEGRAVGAALAAPAGVSLGLFTLAVIVSIGAVGGVDVAALAVVVGVPTLAVAAAVVVVRVCGLDALAARLVFASAWDPARTIRSVVACAARAHADGPACLVEAVGRQADGLLSDGLRLVVAGADARLIRDVLEKRLDRAVAAHARWQHALAAIARYGPIVAIPVIAAVGLAMVGRADEPQTWPGLVVAGGSAALMMLPLLVLVGPAEHEVSRRIAARVLAGTLVVEGVVAIRSGEHSASIENRLLAMLPPASAAMATPAAA